MSMPNEAATPSDHLPDGTPVGGDPQETEYEPPKGDEPWASVLEDVPEVLHPKVVSAFRAQDRAANERIEKLTPYEELVANDIPPNEAAIAYQFAQMLYGQADPNDAVAQQALKEQQLRFFEQYKGILEQRGFLSPQEQAAVQAEAARIQQEQAAFETPEQKAIRELGERQQWLIEQQQQFAQAQQSQQEQQITTQLVNAHKADWESAIAENGQVSKREFQLITMLAQQDPDPTPGTISRAYKAMLETYGRLPDPDPSAGNPQPRPPVAVPSAGGAAIPTPAATDLRIGSPQGRGNRRAAALEAMNQLMQEGAPSA